MDQPHPLQPALPLNQPTILLMEDPILVEVREQELLASFQRFPWQEAWESAFSDKLRNPKVTQKLIKP